MTVLRRMMDLPTPAAGSVIALGIDDFPDLCGRKFGTILVDLDAHQVIDLLSERSSQTSADWMREHPEIDYVSRDRGKDYAQGASEGAPQAVQVSDRFHLMKNFVEAIESEISRCHRHLRLVSLPPFADGNLVVWREDTRLCRNASHLAFSPGARYSDIWLPETSRHPKPRKHSC